MPATRAILHVGTHKTGTTSIQSFVTDRHPDRFRAHGIEPYSGRHIPHNHVELHVAAMRPERMSGFKERHAIRVDDAYVAAVAARIAAALAASLHETLFFSAEGVSLLRHPDELARLKALIPVETDIVIALRERAGFLASYRAQIGDRASTDPADYEHYRYVADDSWIADYAPRLALLRATFGAERVRTIDYDAAMAADGSILPAFLAAIGMGGVFTEAEWRVPFLNVRKG